MNSTDREEVMFVIGVYDGVIDRLLEQYPNICKPMKCSYCENIATTDTDEYDKEIMKYILIFQECTHYIQKYLAQASGILMTGDRCPRCNMEYYVFCYPENS